MSWYRVVSHCVQTFGAPSQNVDDDIRAFVARWSQTSMGAWMLQSSGVDLQTIRVVRDNGPLHATYYIAADLDAEAVSIMVLCNIIDASRLHHAQIHDSMDSSVGIAVSEFL